MTTRNLLSGPITLSAATRRDRNTLHTLDYPQQREAFYNRIEGYRSLLADVVAHHLGIKPAETIISPQEYWVHGSFNLCVPVLVEVDSSSPSKVPQFVTLRFPLPYRVGEATNPGNSDEKINTEAATYAWCQQNCPTVPIPQLYGFGLSTNKRWTNVEYLPWWSRWLQQARRYLLAAFGLQQLSHYACHPSNSLAGLDIGYLLIETITTGAMLSSSWDEKCGDDKLQDNLQRGLARVMLSLASIPLPRIGSFRVHENGYLSLENRPISVQLAMLENEDIPADISRDTTFSTVDDFVLHHLTTLDNRLLHQPNAIRNQDDAWYQMTSLAAAKSMFPQLFRRDLCKGPFVFAFTDLHASNIFVDDEWNITSIIDLEFAGSYPLEFIQTPYWLAGKLIDEIDPLNFSAIHCRFLEHLRYEEQLQSCREDTEPLSSVMQQSWSSGAFWVPIALTDSIAFSRTFYNRLLPDHFSLTKDDLSKADYSFFARLWRPGIHNIIDRKLQDRDGYLERLKAAFSDGE